MQNRHSHLPRAPWFRRAARSVVSADACIHDRAIGVGIVFGAERREPSVPILATHAPAARRPRRVRTRPQRRLGRAEVVGLRQKHRRRRSAPTLSLWLRCLLPAGKHRFDQGSVAPPDALALAKAVARDRSAGDTLREPRDPFELRAVARRAAIA